MEYKNLSKESKAYYCDNYYYELFSKAEDSKELVLNYLLEKTKDKVVLDAGCGSGKYLPFIAKKCNKYYGIDLSNEQLQIAKGKVKTNNVQLFNSNLTTIPLEDNTIDIIYATWVLGTILDLNEREKVIEEFRRVLKPNGIIILVENNINSEFETLRGRDKDTRTKDYNDWVLNHHFKVDKHFNSSFTFTNVGEAKKVFDVIYGHNIASKINSNIINHDILVFIYENNKEFS